MACGRGGGVDGGRLKASPDYSNKWSADGFAEQLVGGEKHTWSPKQTIPEVGLQKERTLRVWPRPFCHSP